MDFSSVLPKEVCKYILGFLPLKDFFQAKVLCKKINEYVKDVITNCITDIDKSFPDEYETLKNKGWSQEMIIYRFVEENSKGHILGTIRQLSRDNTNFKSIFQPEITFWKRILPILQNNFPHVEKLKTRLMPWPETAGELEKKAFFFFQSTLEIQFGKDFTYKQSKQLSSGKIMHLSYTVDKKWFKIEKFFLKYNEQQPTLTSKLSIFALNEINVFKSIKYLYLDGQPYTSFPKVLCQLKDLVELSLKNCGLKIIPEGLVLPKILVLNLEKNSLDKIPISLQKSSSLFTLILNNNCFTSSKIKESLYNEEGLLAFPKLQVLKIKKNPSIENVSTLAEEIRSKTSNKIKIKFDKN